MFFKEAKPMWAKLQEKSMNYHLILKTTVDDTSNSVLYLTAAYTYRLTVNGEFVSYGPARAAEGYARVDEISLDKFGGAPAEIVVEATGYNCRSYVCTMQDSFVTAELRRGEDVLLKTDDFTAYHNTRIVREVQRYAGQRHFVEIFDDRNDLFADENKVQLCEIINGIKYLSRHVYYPEYRLIKAEISAKGNFVYDEERTQNHDRGLFKGKARWGYFEQSEIKLDPYKFAKGCRFCSSDKIGLSSLNAGEYAVFDFGKLYSGFIGWELEGREESDVVIAYSEICFDSDFEFSPMLARNAIEHFIPSGKGGTFTLEPYTARFVAVLVKKGSVNLKGIALRTYERPSKGLREYSGRDADLKRIYDAAIRSFCHNAVDIYTDCPSRERAGWLCDSYFSGRAEYELFGEHITEDNFLENYLLFEKNENLPEGVLPMCYPADVNLPEDGGFIPQWNLWYILEVYDYLTERNKTADREKFRKSLLGVLSFFAKYENSDGLLEDLPSWNFVEWSSANDWIRNVNYPTNFLYSEALYRVGMLFDRSDLLLKANKIREKAVNLSFDGEKFCDHAVRNEKGELINQPHISEAAQYYAALFGGIDIYDKKYERLLLHIRECFKKIDKNGIEFVPVNAFIGFYLRMELLMHMGEKELLGGDIKDFFAKTVIHTDTLWEHRYISGSLDHGFASFVTLAINYLKK